MSAETAKPVKRSPGRPRKAAVAAAKAPEVVEPVVEPTEAENPAEGISEPQVWVGDVVQSEDGGKVTVTSVGFREPVAAEASEVPFTGHNMAVNPGEPIFAPPAARTREELMAALEALEAQEDAKRGPRLGGEDAGMLPNQTPADILATPTLKTAREVVENARGRVVIVHFLQDGLTLLGKTWYRGEEIAMEEGSREWAEACDETGRNVLEYSEDEQLARWGERFYRDGPWKGQGMTAAQFTAAFKEGGAPLTQQELEQLEFLRQRASAAGQSPINTGTRSTFERRPSAKTGPPPLLPTSR